MSVHSAAGLAGLFAEVTDKKLLQTVALIDRLAQRGAVDDLLAPLRPRLQRLKPPRPLTIRRVLTYPLEELLVPAAAWRPGAQRLSRDLLGTIHDIVLGALEPELQARLSRAVAGQTMHDTAALHRAGKELWPVAAARLRDTLPPEVANGDNRGRNRRQQLALAADLLSIGEPLAGVFLDLPAKPVRKLDGDQQQRLGKLLQRLEEIGGRALALGSEALGERLGDPGVLLEVLQHAGEGEPTGMRVAVASEAGRRVVAELDDSADRLRRAGRRPAVAVADEVVQLVGTLSALEAAPADLPVDRAQLKQVARKAAKAVEGHLQSVVFGEVLDGFRALARPEVDDASIGAAEAAARAARRLGAAGRRLGAGGPVDLVIKSALAAYSGALARPGANASEALQLMDQLRIIEIVFGADVAAELLATLRRPAAGPEYQALEPRGLRRMSGEMAAVEPAPVGAGVAATTPGHAQHAVQAVIRGQ